MGHNKFFGICENKCFVEVFPKDETLRRAVLITTGAEPLTDLSSKYAGERNAVNYPDATYMPYVESHFATNMSNMFRGCDLQRVKILDTSNAENLSLLFGDCSNLIEIPELDTSKNINFAYMFVRCTSLQHVPELDTSKGTVFGHMFDSCTHLIEIPNLDTSNGTEFFNMFDGCYLITRVPAIDISKGTDFTEMFRNCSALIEIPELDTSKGTLFSSMFEGCSNLLEVRKLDTSKETTLQDMFKGCSRLTRIPDLFIQENNYSYGDIFRSCTSLTTFDDNPYAPEGSRWQINLSLDLHYCPLNKNSALKVLRGAREVDPTDNKTIKFSLATYGLLSEDDISIATDKGWTVTYQI